MTNGRLTTRAAAALACALSVAACGSSGARLPLASAPRVDPARVLLDVLAERVPSLRAPSEPSDELARAARAARGPARVDANRRLALAHLSEAESADERAARRHRKAAARVAQDVARRTRDAWVAAEMDFVSLLAAWRGGNAREVERRGEAFVERRGRDASELALFAWMVRGEAALGAQRWDQAATAYRVVLGQLDHPLYAFGLWRTAACYRGLGRASDARQALIEADAIGDRRGVHRAARQVADAARAELGLPARRASHERQDE
ncbi:MAG: hypothetical protein IT379_26165 [Deltaproteobacteria bacterium]|nr:hypothetical protein [Deltaproteobacteria bacterium]